jgi:hypothetical protein
VSPPEPLYAPYVDHVPLSDVAAIYRLRNRDPRDAWQIEASVSVEPEVAALGVPACRGR